MATYYFSSAGNDSNAGTSTGASLKTITKFNSFFASLSPGDFVLFNRGDEFPGAMTISRSGSAGNPITIGAYGTGAKPIITGFSSVATWTSIGNGLYESVVSAGLSTLNMVTVNNTFQPLGRFPKLTASNKGYLKISASSGTSSVSSQEMATAPNCVGGEIVTRAAHWILDRGHITAQTSTVVSYTPFTSPYVPQVGFGFFFQNHPNTCTLFGEWAYNSTSHKITMFFGASGPGTNVVKTSGVDSLVTVTSKSYITFDNLAFQGSNSKTFNLSGTNHITISACDITFSGLNGLASSGSDTTISLLNSTVSYTNNNGIDGNHSSSWTITGNTFNKTGMVAGMGVSADGQYEAMSYIGGSSSITLNRVIDSGYIGIFFQGTNTNIQKNFVNGYSSIKDDGAGIYSFNSLSAGSTVLDNICINGIGIKEGTPETKVAEAVGIYMDDNVTGVEIGRNTVANNAQYGIYLHNANNINIHDNTSFDNTITQVEYSNDSSTMASLAVNSNIFFAKLAAEHICDVHNFNQATISQWFTSADNNYYCRPLNEEGSMFVAVSGGSVATNLAGWKTYTGREANSKKTPIVITDVNKIRFEYNDTNAVKVVSLGANYIDVRNVAYNGSITLQPFTSAVLLQTSGVTNQLPTANAGADKNITLPTNSVQLSGSGSDPDGSISTYAWSRVSGPTQFSILSPGSAVTTINNLVQGTYVFQLLVTDNSGGTNADTVTVIVNAGTPANLPPTANAGSDQTITAPSTSVALSGSGTDTDGTIASYSWTKISGPNTPGFSASTSAATNLTGLIPGVYVIQLQVTDDDGATGVDTVTVTVNQAVNILPVANAGVDKVITLPTNSVALTGSGTDADGTIQSYSWTKVSGPAQFNILTPAAAATTINNLVQGTYVFQLLVTDNSGGTNADTMQITVNAAPVNVLPVANAGTDKNIQLPTNSVSQVGSGTDADGTIASYSWTKTSGPAQFTIVSPGSATTTINNLVQGVYVFQLQVTDNSGGTAVDSTVITVVAANVPPVVNAGVDKNIQLPTSGVVLTGSATDSDGTIGSYSWTRVSGPNTPTITGATTAQATLSGMIQGTYVYQLTATDNQGATGSDTVQIIVSPAPANILPVVTMGANKVITSPATSVSINGSATDADGTISSYAWTQVSGPNTAGYSAATSTTTNVTGLVVGVYVFKLSATDNSGGVGAGTVTVTVQASVPVNHPPSVNAGADMVITLPISSVHFAPYASDPDNDIRFYLWSQLSGPATATFDDAGIAATYARNLTVAGVYIFQLKVTDATALFATDTMTVTVNPGTVNFPPVANAGADKALTLPLSSVILNGSGTDSDGTIAAYAWTQVSGPSTATLANAATKDLTASALIAGTYVFNLKVTDNGGAVGNDTVSVVVSAAPTTTVQAESSTSKTATTENTTDSGGGQDLYFSALGKYAKYVITIPATGTYNFVFRTSAVNAGAGLELRKSGVVLASVTIPQTGGLQTWTNVSKSVALTAGTSMTFRVRSSKSVPFGLNYFTFTRTA